MSADERTQDANKLASGAPAEAAPPASRAARPRGRWLRPASLLLGPLVVLVAGTYVYMTTGRYASTDNAYVKADKVVVSAEVAGPIVRVDVRENEHVTAGDVLFVIDDSAYRVALGRADAQTEAVAAYIEGLKASYRQRLEELELARTNVAYAGHELEREEGLTERGLGSEVDVDRARHEFDVANRQIPIVEQALAQLRAQIGPIDLSLHDHAAYRVAKSAVDAAALDLERTVVRAPFDGVASKVPVVGQFVAPGSAVMSVVSDRDVWIEANYKETDLAHVDVGQRVNVFIDTYADREWHGAVESIGQATGAEFSVIPAQNASGNWVKVTQRIPVRIAVRVAGNDPMLRSGMSATVDIDTGYERPAPSFLGFLRPTRAPDPMPALGGGN